MKIFTPKITLTVYREYFVAGSSIHGLPLLMVFEY